MGLPWDRSFQPLLWLAAAFFPFSHSHVFTEKTKLPQLSFSYMDNDCNWNVHKQDGFSFRSNSLYSLYLLKKNDWMLFFTYSSSLLWCELVRQTKKKSPLRGLIACCVTHWDSFSQGRDKEIWPKDVKYFHTLYYICAFVCVWEREKC